MRLYMVRRTRGFIGRHYARQDEHGQYLQFADGRKSYFPQRIPKTLSFEIDDTNPADPYVRFYSDEVVRAINSLILPRYGLGNYLTPKPESPPTPHQSRIIDGLSRVGTRLMGFCRVNLLNAWRAPGPPSCCRLNSTSCATSSSCTPSRRGWTFRWAPKASSCSIPVITMKIRKTPWRQHRPHPAGLAILLGIQRQA